MHRRDALVEELRTAGSLSARELASRLGVSKRTVVRDVAKLREAGVPIQLDPGGYTFARVEMVKRAIDRALLGRRVLLIEYVDGKGVVTSRKVEPSICLGGRGGRWYLVAWCRLREEVRVFRLDRILSAVVTAERFPEPPTPRRDHAQVPGLAL
ncbi:WYL domain-containing protein [Planotetraspora sp. A-T 1434]|uniref:helix-turn-helix transcriptional regulator n=1 Tax=Planotetraspora sp. A-T 1434 TaxID=2979219 RepID=UPI0021C099D4|nr:WYL domain-containing protein [Planotetraspora sp. A-T 1434]MCT9931166.1 WYL domain-containing protein [Planotetraspora sp. A-T 1434]